LVFYQQKDRTQLPDQPQKTRLPLAQQQDPLIQIKTCSD
jgi:hypothetical protein